MPRFWVNTAAQGLVVADTDYSSGGPGPEVAFTRTYNAHDRRVGMFGRGWSFSYDQKVRSPLCKAEGFIAVTGAAGGSTLYTTRADICDQGDARAVVLPPSDPPSARDALTYRFDPASPSGVWELETRDDWHRYRFEPSPAPATGTLTTWLLSAITDPDGHAVSIRRNPDGTIAAVTDAANRTTTFTYNAAKLCTAITPPNAKSITFAYDASNNLIETVDLEGNRPTYAYDADGYLTRLALGARATVFAWDANQNPKQVRTVTDPLGNTQTYTRAGSGISDAKNGEGRVSRYTANTAGQTTEEKDPLGNASTFSYAGGLLASLKKPDYSQTSWTYNTATGDVASVKNRMNGVTSMTYDAATGDLTAITTPGSNTWAFTHDANHHLTGVASPLNRRAGLSYDQSTGRLATISIAGNETRLAYDGHGNLTSLTDAEGAVFSRTFDGAGLIPTAVTDPWNNTNRLEFDLNRRLTKITHPDGSFRQFTYDCCRLTAIRDENGNTTTLAWDDALRLKEIANALGQKTVFGYDRAHALTRVTRPDGQAITMAPDALGRPSSVVYPGGGTIGLTYNEAGRLASLTNQRNGTTTFQYDVGLPWMISDPLGNNTIFSWDSEMRLRTKLNARFNGVDFRYDRDGSLAEIKSWATGTTISSYAYSSATGRLEAATAASGTTRVSYDRAGKVTGISYPDGTGIALARSKGRVTDFTYPGDGSTASLMVHYSYDNRNRIAGLSWGNKQVAFSYDPAGNRTGITRSLIIGYDGTTPIIAPITASSYQYDAASRVTRVNHRHNVPGQGSTAFIDLQFARDVRGDVTRETALRPLSAVVAPGTVAFSHDAADRIVSYAGNTVGYDADGNLTAIAGTAAASFGYDEFNRVVSQVKGGITTTYAYDGFGNRVRRERSGVVTNWHYDHSGRFRYETDGANSVTARWFWAGRRLIASWLKDSGYRWYHFDALGNLVALTDDSGAVTDSFAYGPYGQQAGRAGTTPALFTWVGEHGVVDDGNGIYFMKNRSYDSTLGRFLQKDPIGFAGGINLYSYASNNPVNRIDPSGLNSGPGGGIDLFKGVELLPSPLQGTMAERDLIVARAHNERWTVRRLIAVEGRWQRARMMSFTSGRLRRQQEPEGDCDAGTALLSAHILGGLIEAVEDMQQWEIPWVDISSTPEISAQRAYRNDRISSEDSVRIDDFLPFQTDETDETVEAGE